MLSLILAGLGIIPAFLTAYLLLITLASFRPRAASPPSGRSRLAVLVPAHDEAELIGRCVTSLLDQSYPRHLYRVVVIADNCSDRTAELASQAGAQAWVRDQPEAPGKGQALRWALDRLLAGAIPPDAVVVVDGDSVADPDLLLRLEAELAVAPVVQGDYGLLADEASPRSQLVAAGFLLFHRVRFSGRARLGMAANLVGNGMLFSRQVLEQHPWDSFTGVEDLEHSIRLRLAGVGIAFARQARVWGPMPVSARGATRQRMRWEGGRFHVIRTRLPELVASALTRHRPDLFDAALDLAVPPLGLLAMAILAGTALAATAVLVHLSAPWTLAPWLVALVFLFGHVVIGLASARAPRAAYLALLRVPLFLLGKVLTYGRLLRGFDVNRWERSERRPGNDRYEIAGVPIDPVTMEEALARLTGARVSGGALIQVATVNLDFLINAQRDARVKRILNSTQLNVPDGTPVVWLGRLLGRRVPERVAGADLVPRLIARAAATGARLFLLGGEGGVAAQAAQRLTARHPGLQVAGWLEPPRAAPEAMDNEAILAAIAASGADLLLVAFGHPKQEVWIDLNRERLPVSVAIGVGCVFDLVAGRQRRAPLALQRVGLEWAHRLLHDPRRLLGRYLVDLAWLAILVPRVLLLRLGMA